MPEEIALESDNRLLSIKKSALTPILNVLYELYSPKESGTIKVRSFEALLALSKKLSSFTGITPVLPPKNLNATLREYQQEGLNWLHFLHEYGFGGILADDMGLGKTLQTLTLLSLLKEKEKLTKPALIIVPTSLVANWKNEAKTFTPNLSVLSLYGKEREFF